jgi:hypothetical protein
MTKQRDLKKQVRARAEKTGETYTAARAAMREGKSRFVRHCLGCNAVVPDGPEAEKHVCLCGTPYGECVLPRGHRSDEHGDDHQKADGTWWNVGQVRPVEELVKVRGFAQPVPKELADAIEVLRRRTREDTAVLDALLDEESRPAEPELLFGNPKSGYVVFQTEFDKQVMKDALEMVPKLAKLSPPQPDAPTPAQMRFDHDTQKRYLDLLGSPDGVDLRPDKSCTCGLAMGGNPTCPFHHPPVVPVDIGSVALPSTGDISIQSREGTEGTTDFWLTRGGRDVYRLGYKDREGNTVLATDATCTCPARDGAQQDCKFHHPIQSVDVARRLLDQAVADYATGVRSVVTVDTDDLSPEEFTRRLTETKTRFREELAERKFAATMGRAPKAEEYKGPKCPPIHDGVCVYCGRMPHACECPADPVGTTYARCTNCERVYKLFPTKSRTCEHCGHSPVEIIPVTGNDERSERLRGQTEHRVHLDVLAALEALPPLPVVDVVELLEALKYINSGDAHADEARAEAHEALEDFDKKHPNVLTALMDPRDDEDFDPEEPIECSVNGKLCALPRDATYREVVQAAGFDGERVLTVTYRKGRAGGSLCVGESILVTPKTVFNVVDTSNA